MINNTSRVNTVFYNDLHGTLKNVRRFAVAQDEFYKEHENETNVTIASGDVFMDASANNDTLAKELLPRTDAIAIGNTDINAGNYLGKMIKKFAMQGKWLSCNLRFNRKNDIEDQISKSTIINKNNDRIGVIGVSPLDFQDKLYGKDDIDFIEVQQLEKTKKSIAAAYMERMDKTEDEINQIMDQESWYVGQEAVDAGFCDEIIETGFEESIFLNCFQLNGVPYSFKSYLETVVPSDVRKKVLALSAVKPKESGAFFNKNKEKGSKSMEENETVNMTPEIADASQLKSAYPELVSQIVTEAVRSERARLKSIDEIAAGIPEDVLTKAKYDEPVSAEALALAQMKANNRIGQQTLSSMVSDMTDSGVKDVGSMPNAGTSEAEEKLIQSQAKVGGLAAALGRDKRREKKE